MAAAHYRLDNLTVLLDRNGLQVDGPVAEVMGIQPIKAKWEAFGWHVLEVDGHAIGQILDALDTASQVPDQPQLIIAHTTKGKGCSLAENVVACHAMNLTHEQCLATLAELKGGQR